jgi:ABC-type multidrug transport system ATPase subunit
MRLALEGISHQFPGQPFLFENVNHSFVPGVLTGLVGPSGSGKSTLMAILSGMLKPATGKIVAEDIQTIGWIPQNPIGVPRRTALDHVVFPQLLAHTERPIAQAHARELLERFHLAHVADREFRHLSGGEAQRLCFARASAANFDVLLVDEPTAQLDPITSHTVREVTRQLVAKDRIVILATHDQILREQCDELMDLGVRS